MKYDVDSTIVDFDAMVKVIGPNVARKPEYTAVKSGLPAYLRYLAPLVSGHDLYTREAIEHVLPQFLRETTSIKDDQISEKAIYFGVMAFSTLAVLKRRDNYSSIDFQELEELWNTQSLYPIESLKRYGFFEVVNINGLDVLLQGFLRLHVQPLITSSEKMTEAMSHFETQFFSGVLLGQIVAFLILRDYSDQ
jgi:hypothetical protein